MRRGLRPRDEREARTWYCADAFGDVSSKWGSGLAERTRRRQPITREWVADMLGRAAAASGPSVPPKIQQVHERTAKDRRQIRAAMDYIASLR
jgi:hypothetical protein